MSRHTTVPEPALLALIVGATVALIYWGRKAAAKTTAPLTTPPLLTTGSGSTLPPGVPESMAEHVGVGLVTDALDAAMLA
jgi:hypothetical protein